VDGNGSVALDPDQPTYYEGDSVQLTAIADSGWTFVGWSGDLTSTNNPETITLLGDTSITATFTRSSAYALTIDIEGEGSVSMVPSELIPNAGYQALLTAVPDAGWEFDSWSGDITSTDNPLNLDVQDDTAITANFSSGEYVLTVISDHGSVTIDPDQATYQYGDVVTLSATPDPGWEFANWSGDVSGTDNPIQITITDDMTVTATYVEVEYTLTVNIIGN
jgi:uncharacterized repeat protein (TIGR02543 family)